MFRSRVTRHVMAASAAAVSVMLFASASQADGTCRSVEGRYREQDASGPTCSSPVGLCIIGQYRGDIGIDADELKIVRRLAETTDASVVQSEPSCPRDRQLILDLAKSLRSPQSCYCGSTTSHPPT